MGTDAVKNIVEVGIGIKVAQLAGGNQAVDKSGPFGTGVASRKLPFFAADLSPQHGNSDDALISSARRR